MIQIKKFSPQAIIPSRAHDTDAGYDLHSIGSHTLFPHERKLIKTGIGVAIPEGYYGRIAPRSGLAYKHGIDVLAGVIDSGYRNEIGVILINFGDKSVDIENGDRIAQLIIEQCFDAEFAEVEDFLDQSDRGTGGFGSTGV